MLEYPNRSENPCLPFHCHVSVLEYRIRSENINKGSQVRHIKPHISYVVLLTALVNIILHLRDIQLNMTVSLIFQPRDVNFIPVVSVESVRSQSERNKRIAREQIIWAGTLVNGFIFAVVLFFF